MTRPVKTRDVFATAFALLASLLSLCMYDPNQGWIVEIHNSGSYNFLKEYSKTTRSREFKLFWRERDPDVWVMGAYGRDLSDKTWGTSFRLFELKGQFPSVSEYGRICLLSELNRTHYRGLPVELKNWLIALEGHSYHLNHCPRKVNVVD